MKGWFLNDRRSHALARVATVLVLVLLWLAPTLCLAAEPPTRHVLLIGVDGCRPDALQAAKTPHLDKLAAGGLVSLNTSILGPRPTTSDTISGPGWSSIFTGVWSDKHGVLDNSFKGSNYDDFPHFFARIKEVHPEAVTGSFSDWGPIAENIVSAATVKESPAPGKGGGADGYRVSDIEVTRKAADFLKSHDPIATCVYLGQIDETGHAKGFHPSVPEYIAAIERVDAHIGEILMAVAARPNIKNEEWLVIVTTDHGGEGTGHGDGHQNPDIRQVFLIVSGPHLDQTDAARQTYIVDGVATALTWLNIPLDPAWKIDGTPFGLKPIK